MNPVPDTPRFYYSNNGVTIEGPHTWERLLEFLGNSVISNATTICQADAKEWTRFGDFMLAEEQVLTDLRSLIEPNPE